MNAAEFSAPKVTVITLNWNGRNDTIECLASLQRLNYPNYQVVVVDNGSVDGSAATFRESFPQAIVIENSRNLGYAEGFNVGLHYAFQLGADYSLILNNDTLIDPDALLELVRVAEQDIQVGFVTGKVYSYGEPLMLQTVGRDNDPILLVGRHIGNGEVDHGQYDKMQELNFVDDVFLLVRMTVFEQVGGYDPTFFLMFEETDWCARVRRAGFKIVYTPKAKIWHKGNKSVSVGRSVTHQFYLSRNLIPFIRRNSTPHQFRRFMLRYLFSYKQPYAPREAWRLLRWGQYRLLAAHLRGIGSGLVWLLRNRQTGG
jgi:GT2 family glycosyltransferase